MMTLHSVCIVLCSSYCSSYVPSYLRREAREALSWVGVRRGRSSLGCWTSAPLELNGRVRKLELRRQDLRVDLSPGETGQVIMPPSDTVRGLIPPCCHLKIKACTPAALNDFLIQSNPSYVPAF